MDPVVADKCLPTLVVGDEDKFHRPFCGGEDGCRLVGLFAGTNRMCSAGRIRMRLDMMWWPLIAAESHGVPSEIGRIKTTGIGVSCVSEEERA